MPKNLGPNYLSASIKNFFPEKKLGQIILPTKNNIFLLEKNLELYYVIPFQFQNTSKTLKWSIG